MEQGGTYVALQETGRHTMTEKDAWPIESLTGFHVKQIRPMGGFVSILPDQPMFTKLAGQNFENEGKSIDYSGYNFADKCIALEPVAPGTQALARYRDGAIAIGMRTLGKGRVIVLGSPFWRDSYDRAGMWWPGDGQNAFLQDLLTGLGLPPDVPGRHAESLAGPLRRQQRHGRIPAALQSRATKTRRRSRRTGTLPVPITQIFDPKTGQTVDAKIDGSTAHLSQTLQPLETRILARQSQRPPADTVADWYAIWRRPGRSPCRAIPSPIRRACRSTMRVSTPQGGKIVETASVTPERLAALSSAADSGKRTGTRT